MTRDSLPPNQPMHRRLRRLAYGAGTIAALIGAAIFAGWLFDSPAAHNPKTITMKPNAALALLLCGVGLLLLTPNVGGWRQWVGRTCAATAALLAILTLSQHLVGWNLGIDQLFAQEPPGAAAVTSPNRMGPPAALSFTLLGIALLTLSVHSRQRPIHQYLALIVVLIALLPTAGYLYSAKELYGIAKYTGIAWPTAATLLALALGVLCARPDEGLMATITANDAGGSQIRRFLLPSLLLPLILGWMHLFGERHEYYDPALGIALVMLVQIIAFTVLACYSGRQVSRETSATQHQRELLKISSARYELLTQTASDLLATDSPQTVVERLCRRVMEQIDCQVFLNFLVDDQTGRLHLNAYAGISSEEALHIQQLDPGVAVCGCVAQSGQQIVAEEIPTTPDARTDLVRPYGVRAYACYPLLAGGKLIGTLSFGTKTRSQFAPDELSMMKAVTDQVAAAMERIRLFEQAKHQAAELVVANQAKDQFIATLSHELRTPLTPILMLSQLLQQDASLPDDVRKDMKIIRQNVVLEARLIDDLLDLTRITRGKVHLKQEIVELNDLLGHAFETCRDTECMDKNLKIEWNLAVNPSTLWADPARMQQVFGNLIHNAVKFTPAGGVVAIRTAITTPGKLRVEISDTGEGIEPGKLASIFNPFEQGGDNRTRRSGGLGLGLAIAKAIVDLHGGQITANSNGHDQGTTVRVDLNVLLPTEDSPASAPDGQASRPQQTNGNPHILLIEDHQPTAVVLQRLGAKWGWRVQWAASAKTALDMAAHDKFDMVISDLGLPDGNGHDVMRQLHRRHGLRGVAVSGYGADDDIAQSLESGFITHMTKPVNFDELRDVVSDFLAGAAPRA